MTNRTKDVRTRILQATADLLAQGGREAASTRSVSIAAGVQAPTIYRQFGDMRGLLDAVAQETLAEYVRQMALSEPADDALEALRRGWDEHVAFGLANPAVYALIYSDPTAAANTPAARDDLAILHGMVGCVAQAGRLRVSISHAANLLAAAGSGVTLALIATPPEARDAKLSTGMREAVIAAITTAPTTGSAPDESNGPERVVARAVALQAVMGHAPAVLSPAERQLLNEWLDRLAAKGG